MNFTNLKKIPSFTEIIIKVRNHKNGKLVQKQAWTFVALINTE